MATPLQTPQLLPDPKASGRRFTADPIGTNTIDKVREEFYALRRVAALLCGVPPEEVSMEHLMGAEARVLEWREKMRTDPEWVNTQASEIATAWSTRPSGRGVPLLQVVSLVIAYQLGPSR